MVLLRAQRMHAFAYCHLTAPAAASDPPLFLPCLRVPRAGHTPPPPKLLHLSSLPSLREASYSSEGSAGEDGGDGLGGPGASGTPACGGGTHPAPPHHQRSPKFRRQMSLDRPARGAPGSEGDVRGRVGVGLRAGLQRTWVVHSRQAWGTCMCVC